MPDHENEDTGQPEGSNRLGGLVHAVQEAVAERVAPATSAVSSALHEAGQVAAHLRARISPSEETPDPGLVPSGALIVRPGKQGTSFLAWRSGRWAPVHRVHGVGWVWSE